MSGYVNSILHGDALSQLDKLPDECIDCVITSPPYWSLRKYNTSLVWDGDSDCEHDFSISNRIVSTGGEKSAKVGNHKKPEVAHFDVTSNACSKCGAWKGELGLEPSFDLYIEHLVQIFAKVWRVLKEQGSIWIVIGDTYGRGDRQHQAKQTFETNEKRHIHMPPKTGLPKSLIQIPARFAIKMIDDGWILRNDIIWHKKNPMPSSAKDRFAVDYEHIYFFTKSPNYYFQTQYEPYSEATMKEFGQIYNGKGKKDYAEAGVQNPSDVKRRIIASLGKSKMPPIGGIKNVGRDFTAYDRTYSGNTPYFGMKGRIARTVWTINTQPSSIKHYATYPERIVSKILDAVCPPNGICLDPFFGAGTTGLVALKMNRRFVGIEPNSEYIGYANKRLDKYLNQEKLEIGLQNT